MKEQKELQHTDVTELNEEAIAMVSGGERKVQRTDLISTGDQP